MQQDLRCYNTAVNWGQIERWATIALYLAAGVGLTILLVRELTPQGSPSNRASKAGEYLTALGEISGGMVFVIILVARHGRDLDDGTDRQRY